jgi:hypothetical protein
MMAVSGSKIDATHRPSSASSSLDGAADNRDEEPGVELRPWFGVTTAGLSGTF